MPTLQEAKADLDTNYKECPFCHQPLKRGVVQEPLPKTILNHHHFANVYEVICTNPDCDYPNPPFRKIMQIDGAIEE